MGITTTMVRDAVTGILMITSMAIAMITITSTTITAMPPA